MSLIRRIEVPYDRDHAEWAFWCPGCQGAHTYVLRWGPLQLAARKERLEKLEREFEPAPHWIWNGSFVKPTFNPSLLYTWHLKDGTKKVCHLFVTDGKINYLPDSTHQYAGMMIEMEDW